MVNDFTQNIHKYVGERRFYYKRIEYYQLLLKNLIEEHLYLLFSRPTMLGVLK